MPSRMRHILLLIGLATLWLSGAAAAADSPARALAQADNTTRADMITGWASKTDPALKKLLIALQNEQLLIDEAGQPYFQTDDGVINAETGAKVEIDPETLETITINNRVTGAIEVALAADDLGSPDLALRSNAVAAMNNAGNPALLPLVESRLKLETDASLKVQLGLLVANLKLAHPDPKIRLAAVISLGESTDPGIKGKLEPLTQVAGEPDATVRAAAAKSLAAVERRLFTQEMIGHAFSGLSLGSVLLLAALGLAITYGLLGVINMAHGELLMIGAYTTYVIQGVFQRYLPGAMDWYLLAALPAAFFVAMGVGILLERLVIRHLYGRPLDTLLATWGISLLLIQIVRNLFGAQNVQVSNPSWMSGGWEVTAALTLPYNRMVIIVFAFAVLMLTWLILNKTRLGLFVRAVTQNRRMADSVGVPTGKVDMLAFGLGSGIAGLAGVALSQIGNVGPELGQGYIIDSFMVVVLGGVGQLAGSVFASLGLGVVSKILEPSIGAVLAKIAILVFIIIFIQKRPQGMFALKGRSLD